MGILFAGGRKDWPRYQEPLRAALDAEGIDLPVATEMEPQDVQYIVYAPSSDLQDFSVFPNLRAVLNLWAGVEEVIGNPTLSVPLCRMVDHGLTRGMVEWVTGHVLRHHLGIDTHIHAPPGTWEPIAPPLAENRRVCIAGLGVLGAACAEALVSLGFDVSGWSRNPKQLPGVTCHSGALIEAVTGAEILVLLLPDTPATENALDADTIAALAPGAVVINPGRAPLIGDDALIAALDAGHLSHATLDVFRTEPLPASHPFWHHPKVTVTPHIASETRPDTASICVAQNIKRDLQGDTPLHVVDRGRGY